VRVDENGLLGGDRLGRAQPPPHRPLLGPDRAAEHLSQVALGDRLAAWREADGQDLGLDVGGEEQQVHHLGQAGAGEAVVAGDVGVVAELAGLDAGQQAGDPGGVSLAQTGLAAGAALVVLLAAGPDRSFRDLRRGLGFLGLGHPISPGLG